MTSTAAEHSSWTAAGSDATAQRTYASIQAALSEIQGRRGLDIFLQGSYANATNIRADSDVDVVAMTTHTFRGSLERLQGEARRRWEQLPAATYTVDELRSELIAALSDYYGTGYVEPRNKCIKVHKRDGYVDADVVPAIQYRWYRYSDSAVDDYVEGIAIKPQSGGWIINFPKEHIANGRTKQYVTNNRYKSTVRQIKRLRIRAVSEGRLGEDEAPGYLLECMTYNAPNSEFVYDDSTRLRNVLFWLKFADKTAFLSCDGIHRLFVDDPGRFTVDRAQRVVDALWAAY